MLNQGIGANSNWQAAAVVVRSANSLRLKTNLEVFFVGKDLPIFRKLVLISRQSAAM